MKHIRILGKAAALAVIVVPAALALTGCGGSASADSNPADGQFKVAMMTHRMYVETNPDMYTQAHYFCDALDDGATVDQLWAGVVAKGLKEHVGRDDNDKYKAEQAAILVEAVKAYCPQNQWKVDSAS